MAGRTTGLERTWIGSLCENNFLRMPEGGDIHAGRQFTYETVPHSFDAVVELQFAAEGSSITSCFAHGVLPFHRQNIFRAAGHESACSDLEG